ncbi:putative Membrane-associated kinase regulator [Heracleum sosnowskyi]|uniref:Membrane-associated kinase regulator n=1 Tax=Heracleum sosnowskyi TaxID=360622 RepID=A0AAD8M8F2_9APIA|nr:putative Membrane-associated kinase regulator [Heracleum sosnowskyi]
MQSNTPISQSPSFDTYSSSNRLSLIAARVVHEFQPHADLDEYLSNHDSYSNSNRISHDKDDKFNTIDDHEDDNDEEDEDFEFPSVSQQADTSSNCNGLIGPAYPLFDTKLLLENDENDRNLTSPTTAILSDAPVRLPLRKLFSEERERDSPSCSSSEADELDRVPAEMYCVWKPKTAEKSPENCKKSNSTGSSKRWKFRDFLRSNSEGKDSFVFLTNPIKRRDTTNKIKKVEKDVKVSGKVNDDSGEVPATLEYRLRNERVERNDQRRMVVPYKTDIVGMFADVNGVSRNLRPF